MAIGDGCWEWTGAKDNNGYGCLSRDGKTVRAHREAYELWSGQPPRAFVCHYCDNPPCVRPSHLFDASHLHNMADMANKGRHPLRCHVLLPPDRALLSRRAQQGESLAELAREFCVSHTTAWRISRERWPLSDDGLLFKSDISPPLMKKPLDNNALKSETGVLGRFRDAKVKGMARSRMGPNRHKWTQSIRKAFLE